MHDSLSCRQHDDRPNSAHICCAHLHLPTIYHLLQLYRVYLQAGLVSHFHYNIVLAAGKQDGPVVHSSRRDSALLTTMITVADHFAYLLCIHMSHTSFKVVAHLVVLVTLCFLQTFHPAQPHSVRS